MTRKIIRAGNSLAVTIPADVLEHLGLEAGSEVEVELDREHAGILIRPARLDFDVDPEFKALVDDIIERYRPALESLAKR